MGFKSLAEIRIVIFNPILSLSFLDSVPNQVRVKDQSKPSPNVKLYELVLVKKRAGPDRVAANSHCVWVE
jgi:hypothetical protein